MNLIKGNCLIEMKKLEDKSVDFVYLDLPYGQTACAWDVKLDLEELWKELKRVARNDRTPFFFSCTTKFGYELIKANEKWFRWDLVWEKNRAAGFLNAYRLPMRKHEMIYCFAKNSPQYDVSSHSEFKEVRVDRKAPNAELYGLDRGDTHKIHKDPLPTSICPPSDEGLETYAPQEHHELVYCFAKNCPDYDVSSHSEYSVDNRPDRIQDDLYGKVPNVNRKTHTDPLPTSICPPQENHELVYCFAKKSPDYDVSSHSEFNEDKRGDNQNMVGDDIETYGKQGQVRVNSKTHKHPLPTSILPPSDDHELVYCFAKNCPDYDVSSHSEGGLNDNQYSRSITCPGYGKDKSNIIKPKSYKDPLPTSICPQQPSSWCKFHLDNKTGHRTAKPVKLMEYLLKYWTSPDSVVLDPTMGSGSMGIACKKMGRNFIGIELDDDIYELATKRIGEAVSDEEAIKKEKIQKEKSEKEKLEKEKLREIAKQAKAKLPKKPRAKKKSVSSK